MEQQTGCSEAGALCSAAEGTQQPAGRPLQSTPATAWGLARLGSSGGPPDTRTLGMLPGDSRLLSHFTAFKHGFCALGNKEMGKEALKMWGFSSSGEVAWEGVGIVRLGGGAIYEAHKLP